MTTDYSVFDLPGNVAAAFISDSSSVFREDGNLLTATAADGSRYIPWGGDNQMPYDIFELFDKDETMTTCQVFNAEMCYGGGLIYDTAEAQKYIIPQVEQFMDSNDIPSYFMGCCMDFKYFGFAVSVIILSADGQKIEHVCRKEACYCRFAPADSSGRIPYLLYANWRGVPTAEQIEKIEVIDAFEGVDAIRDRFDRSRCRKFAVVSRIPTPDSTYYPIPYYGSLFRGKWYNIKQLIGVAKEAKLRNSAPIKYHIEISKDYWKNLFKSAGITDVKEQQLREKSEKAKIIEFLTRAENSGKVWFSQKYTDPDGHEHSDVTITKVDASKEGGDWSADIQEAVNMICFTLRVHSNLVGSVPGKSQTNNSGSDKRELYTITQTLQKPYHDILFKVHRLIIQYNKWQGVRPSCPFLQLTTLDEHRDAKQVEI